MPDQFSNNKKKCLYCGNNQTSHPMTWFESTLAVVMSRTSERTLASPFWQSCFVFAEKLLLIFMRVLVFLRVVSFSDDIAKAPIRRGQVLWEEARRRGIEMQNMRFLGRPTDIFRYKKNNHWEYFNGLPRVGRDNPALAWIDDKAILKKRLLHAGVPVPAGGSFSNFPDMAKAFENLQKPVIVKPRLGSRGRHTTTHIYTPEELRHAYVVGKELCYYVIMEEHIVGSVYRGTVIDGKLAGVLAGEPPKIIGDGMHTIVELARMKNDSRDSRIKDVLINHMMQDFLARQGYSFDAVLPAGITIDLSEKIGTSYGGKSIEVTDETHPKIKQALEAAARAIGDPILGFDFIIADVTADPDDIKWGIIECNAVPFIQLHHEPLEGTPQNVAGKIWEYVFKND